MTPRLINGQSESRDMPPAGHAPEWPDKAMFAAILLVLAGAVGLAFALVKPILVIDEDGLPTVFADQIPGYTVTLCSGVLVAGVLSLWRQAALFAYLGAALALASLAVYGLVPILGLLAVATMVKSHLEGEETRNDGIQVHPSKWPDKALAASLFILVVAAIAITQAFLLIGGRLTALLWGEQSLVAGLVGLAIGLVGVLAAREVYNLRRAWMGWFALVLGLGTLGFYLIGPVLALIGMALLGLAHREQEFLAAAAGEYDPASRRRRRRTRPALAKPVA